MSSHYKSTTLQKTKYLPKLKNTNKYNPKSTFTSTEKFYDTRGK